MSHGCCACTRLSAPVSCLPRSAVPAVTCDNLAAYVCRRYRRYPILALCGPLSVCLSVWRKPVLCQNARFCTKSSAYILHYVYCFKEIQEPPKIKVQSLASLKLFPSILRKISPQSDEWRFLFNTGVWEYILRVFFSDLKKNKFLCFFEVMSKT